MKLNFQDERVLGVVAHPDDAELLCAGTLARAQRDGADVAICVLCNGDKGQSTRVRTNLTSVRRREMSRAAKLAGASLFAEDNPDGSLQDNEVSRLRLVEVYRRFKPTLVLAHAPEDYHPDHRAASALAEAASWFCASRGHKTPSMVMEAAPALWWMDTLNMIGFEPGFFVDISEFIGLKVNMLACHESQLERGADKDFSPLAELMRLQFRARGAQAGVAAAEAFRAHQVFKRARAW
jgi:LmbE family N-acetylglucosaminyl deacetylase